MSETRENYKDELPYLMGEDGVEYNDEINKLKLVELPKSYNANDDFSKFISDYLSYREISDSGDNLDFSTDLAVINALNADEQLNNSVLNNNIQLLKTIANRKQNIEHNKKYNLSMDKMLKEEIDITTKDVKMIEDSLHDKTRSREVKNYYSDKKKHQSQIIKTLIYISFFMLGVSFVYKINLMSDSVFVAFIAISLVVLVVYAILAIYDIIIRDDIVYDEYSFISPPRYNGKNNTMYDNDDDIPLYEQEDLISNKCYNIMKNNSS